jgi:hypothetical protein
MKRINKRWQSELNSVSIDLSDDMAKMWKGCEERNEILCQMKQTRFETFFFEMEPAWELHIVLKRRKPRKAKYKHVQICTTRSKLLESLAQQGLHQACNNKLETCFAPTIAHRPASSLIFWRSCVGADSLRSKILAFLSFHTSQQTSSRCRRCAIYVFPPSLYRVSWHPGRRSQLLITQPYCNAFPYTPSVASVLK